MLTAVRLQIAGRDVVLPSGFTEGQEDGGWDALYFYQVAVDICGGIRLDGQHV